MSTIFWIYLWTMATDTSVMSHDEIIKKIIYDVFIDIGNYEHTLPVFLLLIEFFINNIIFCWTHFFICLMIQFGYTVFQISYCLITKTTVYETIDWNKNFGDAFMKSFISTFVMTCWFLIIYVMTKSKFWINGLQKRIDQSNETYKQNMDAYYARYQQQIRERSTVGRTTNNE